VGRALAQRAAAFSGLLQAISAGPSKHDMAVKEVVGDRLLLSFILNFSVILFTWAVDVSDRACMPPRASTAG